MPRGHSTRIPGIPDEVRDRELRDFDLIDLSMRGSGLQYDPPIWTTRWSDLGHWTPLARDLRCALWAAFGYVSLEALRARGTGLRPAGCVLWVCQFVAPSVHSRLAPPELEALRFPESGLLEGQDPRTSVLALALNSRPNLTSQEPFEPSRPQICLDARLGWVRRGPNRPPGADFALGR